MGNSRAAGRRGCAQVLVTAQKFYGQIDLPLRFGVNGDFQSAPDVYKRQVLRRAKEAAGDYDIEFIGDSITQGWEGRGSNVWQEFYGKRKVINFGVSGDRTEHVLWRFEQGQLDGIKAKVAVVMIGTNNSGKNKDGSDTYTDADILEGVVAVVNQIRTCLLYTSRCV